MGSQLAPIYPPVRAISRLEPFVGLLEVSVAEKTFVGTQWGWVLEKRTMGARRSAHMRARSDHQREASRGTENKDRSFGFTHTALDRIRCLF
jgi:hypothetical protein